MMDIKKFFLRLLTAAVFALPMTIYAACGSNDKKITFIDGATACLNEFNFLNIKGLMKPFPNESYSSKSQSIKTYAIAVSADPLFCPFEHSMQWDHSTGDNDRRAINACESRMPAAIQAYGKSANVQSCKCEILIDNGKTKFSKAEFDQRTKQYERQIALGFRPIQIVEAQIKEQADREAETIRQAEVKKREDDRLVAMKERAEREAREEAERKKNAPPPIFAMRRALVIGNDNYKYVEKLQNAKEDAKAMSIALKQVGFDVTEKFDLGQKETIASIREFQERINPGDEILFFFAGHGVEIDGKNYLVPTDNLGEGKYVKEDSIDLKMSVLETFEKRKAKITIAVIDACRNNPFKSDGRSMSGRGLAPTTAATGQMIIQSAGAGQKALDRLVSDPPETKNGVFTRVFVKEMLKPGIPIFQMVRNVRSEVVSLAQSVGSDQMPSFYDQVNGDFYFKK
jgi:hypothetical protein